MWQPNERYPDANVRVLDPSFSKYRLGIGQLARRGEDPGYDEPLRPAFEEARSAATSA